MRCGQGGRAPLSTCWRAPQHQVAHRVDRAAERGARIVLAGDLRERAPVHQAHVLQPQRRAARRAQQLEAPAAVEVDAYKVGDSTNIKWHEGSVDTATREKAMNQKGCVLWFTGLSGSGKVRPTPSTTTMATFSRSIRSRRFIKLLPFPPFIPTRVRGDSELRL